MAATFVAYVLALSVSILLSHLLIQLLHLARIDAVMLGAFGGLGFYVALVCCCFIATGVRRLYGVLLPLTLACTGGAIAWSEWAWL